MQGAVLEREPDGVLAGVIGVKVQADDVLPDLRELYTACYGRLVGVLTLAAGSQAEAEDVVQEAFIRLLPRWARVCRYDDPEAWVRRVAFRLLWNRFRRARNALAALRRSGPGQNVAAPSVEPVDVGRALAALSLPQRQVVVLHHLLDMSVEQVAIELGIPVGTVKSRLVRARATLAPLLREDAGDRASYMIYSPMRPTGGAQQPSRRSRPLSVEAPDAAPDGVQVSRWRPRPRFSPSWPPRRRWVATPPIRLRPGRRPGSMDRQPCSPGTGSPSNTRFLASPAISGAVRSVLRCHHLPEY